MNIISDARFLDRVFSLMRRKSTGNRKEFAEKLSVSKRTLNRRITEMKENGLPIEFCKSSNSYIFTEPITYEFRITIANQDLLKINGGYKPSLDLLGCENL